MAIDGSGGPEFKRRRRLGSPAPRAPRPPGRRPAAQELGRRQTPAAGALQLGQEPSAPSPQATRERAVADVRAPRPGGAPADRRGRAPRQHLDRLAAERRCARRGTDRRRACGARSPPPAARQSIGASAFSILRGVGHAVVRLRPWLRAGRAAAAPSAATISAAAERGQRVMQAWRWCRRQRSASPPTSSMAPVSRPASICMMRDAGLGVAGLDRALDRRRAAPARQQRGVDVEAAAARGSVQHPRRQDQAVGGDHQHVGRAPRAAPPAPPRHRRRTAVQAQPARLRHRQAVLEGERLDRRRPAASCRGRPGGRAGSGTSAISKPAACSAASATRANSGVPAKRHGASAGPQARRFFARLLQHPGLDAVALERAQVLDEHLAEQVVHLVLDAHREQALGLELARSAPSRSSARTVTRAWRGTLS